MASSLTGKKHQLLSTCGICLEKYHNPRRLRCQHYFCEDCLKDWIKHKRGKIEKIVCPTCKRKTPIPAEGVTDFPVVKMAEVKENYSNKLCSKCKKPNMKAVVYCQDWEHYLCQSCLDVHNTWWGGMKPHSVATIEDLVSGKVTVADTKHKYCTDHEDEQNKFYCKTCNKLVCRDCILMVQHCRDHEYVMLKDAAKEKVHVIEEKMKKCDRKEKECQDAIEKIRNAVVGLDKAADDARASYAKMKSDYLHQVEEFFTEKERVVTSLQQKRKAALDRGKNDIESLLKQLQSAREQGTVLNDSASHFDIVVKYNSILDALEKLSKRKLTDVDDSLVDIPVMSIPSTIEFTEGWKLVGQCNVSCEKSDEGPRGIAVTSDGKIAVCDYWRRVQVLSRSGNLICTIIVETLGGSGDVSITSTNGYAIPMYSKCCKLYHSKYHLLSEFKTYNAIEKQSEARAVSVDKNGCIILGMDNAISIHKTDGSLKSCFVIPTKPLIAVTSREEIAIAGADNTLRLYNYSGKCIQTLDPPPQVKTWRPWYVCCSKKDELFVVNRGDPKAIYKYAAGRVYMGCVTTEVSNPWGIALSHDDQELYVTEESEKLVKIFRKQ